MNFAANLRLGNPLLALVASALLASQSIAADVKVVETRTFADVGACVSSAVAKHGAEGVLLVCDIDNTLLAMEQDLGSDQWFEWQSFLLEHEPESRALVASSFAELLEAQGLLFSLGQMAPPEPEIPQVVAQAQALGVKTLVVTSRGDEFRIATLRELVAGGYDFASHAPDFQTPPRGVYLPYAPESPELAGISVEQAREFVLGEPRLVSYDRGVFMTAGQHKGAMLLTMFHRMKQPPEAVIFVDDHGRHITRVVAALAESDIDLAAIHYKHEDDRVNRFKYGNKDAVTKKWRRLKKTIDAVFAAPTEKEPASP